MSSIAELKDGSGAVIYPKTKVAAIDDLVLPVYHAPSMTGVYLLNGTGWYAGTTGNGVSYTDFGNGSKMVQLAFEVTGVSKVGIDVLKIPADLAPSTRDIAVAMPGTSQQIVRWLVRQDGTIRIENVTTTFASGNWFPLYTSYLIGR